MKKSVLSGLRPMGYTNEPGFDSSAFEEEKLKAIRELIRLQLKPVKSAPNSQSVVSSTLKSFLERYAQKIHAPIQYFENGYCIYAMILEGYKVKRVKDDQRAYINVSKRSYYELQSLVNPSIYDMMKQKERSSREAF